MLPEDVSGSFSSAKVLYSLPHIWVTSHEAFGYFYRNMAHEHSPGKQYSGVTSSVHVYATKTAFDSRKLWGEVFDGHTQLTLFCWCWPLWDS